MIDEREAQLRLRLKTDFEFYAKKCLFVKDKVGRIARLELNKSQLYLHSQLEKQLEETGMIRALVLKGRQQGVSTYTEGRYYWKVTHRRGVRAFILTHEDAATQNLFEMASRYHTNCPHIVRPETGTSNAKELTFGKLDSGYKLGTAGTKAVGRSSTVQYFHGSEIAFWPHADSHFSGIMQAIPHAPGTEVILESTANGAGGKFYEMWQDAEKGKGEFIAIFMPWFWQSEYSVDPKEFTFTDKERTLAKLYSLSESQLAWRQLKIQELGEDLFHQEYPCTAQEAFLVSGRPAFDPKSLMEAELECFSPKYRAEVTENGNIFRHEEGALRVWDEPVSGKRYVIGADVAEGLTHGDYSCAQVLSVPDGLQVAEWHGHVDPDRFGDVLVSLGKRYNRAFIGVERNNHGLTTLTNMLHTGYANMYVQHDIEHRSGQKQTKKLGWLTTRKSKPKIIDQLISELRDGDHGIVCKELIGEMKRYQIDANGSYNAQDGYHDDRVMARAIAGEMMAHAPRNRLTETW
jgi:hypothetical protein